MSIPSSDLVGGSAWERAIDAPSATTPSAATPLFEDAAEGGDVRITADAGSGQRGLTVAEHADRVLAFLRGDRPQR